MEYTHAIERPNSLRSSAIDYHANTKLIVKAHKVDVKRVFIVVANSFTLVIFAT